MQELNFKGMARVLDDKLEGAERNATPVAGEDAASKARLVT